MGDRYYGGFCITAGALNKWVWSKFPMKPVKVEYRALRVKAEDYDRLVELAQRDRRTIIETFSIIIEEFYSRKGKRVDDGTT